MVKSVVGVVALRLVFRGQNHSVTVHTPYTPPPDTCSQPDHCRRERPGCPYPHTEYFGAHRLNPEEQVLLFGSDGRSTAVQAGKSSSDCHLLRNITKTSRDNDVLLPYAQGRGPTLSHRYVRDCQSTEYGNTTYESCPSSKHSGQPVAESKVFVTDVQGSRWVYGHMTIVHDPLRTVSVLEPGGPDGCSMKHTVSVEETAKAAGCLYAQNAGFFDTKSRMCLGNVVSNGRLVQDSGGVQNAQFGIRRDGTLVFGYLSQRDVLDESNPFVQLVSGVMWLLRDGEIYINQSLEAECDKTQETGQLKYFTDVVSARTAVGHDKDGNLILFHIDGQTEKRGMNLWQVATFLKEYKVINAINLDGGGSSTYVINGSLSSYPSDHCKPDGRWRCGRNVSTILCIHARRCQPADCSGNGECVDGHCRCHQGWQGDACDSLVCQSTCSPHGLCTPNGCVCDAGWRGKNCSHECSSGFYGDGCGQTCLCANGGFCDPVHGRCTCTPGFQGESCQEVCPLGFFGVSCTQQCQCEDLCPCDPQTGSCNATMQGNSNHTLYRAGHCLAKQMFAHWKQEKDAHKKEPYLTELTWLLITLILAFLLSASILVHFVQACRSSVISHFPERHDYSYVPLTDINGAAPRAGNAGKSLNGDFVSEDSDSQDEIWSPDSRLDSGRL